MRLGLIGFGAMGKEVARIAKERGHEIVAIVDPKAAEATAKVIDAKALEKAEACIDFSSLNGVMENIEKTAALKKNMVVGTTGWYEHVGEARKIVGKRGIGFVYASNFSVGVNAFYRIVAEAAKAMNGLKEYDVFGYELHHNRKQDSPSGTAKSLAKIIVNNFSRKKKLDRKIEADELHFASIRGGSVPGTHVIGFDSAADSIELKHEARSRAGFALGAVLAAEWIKGKKGFFEVNDFMNDLLEGKHV